MNKKLFDFIASSPTAFHAVKTAGETLKNLGYTELSESSHWNLERGKGYFVTRNGSSLIAFRVPTGDFSGFMMTAAHCDSPAFKIKENAELLDGHFLRLSVEKYGSMLCSTWLDRPLAVAGRVTLRTEKGISVKLMDTKEPCALIPNVAIHMNRTANENMSYNPAVDMIPLFAESTAKGSFRALIAENRGGKEEDILTTDLIVYNPQEGVEWNGYISAPRLDDLQCCFASLTAFIEAESVNNIPVCCLFDNEEVGSQTKQGAASHFFSDTIERVSTHLGLSFEEHCEKVANSFLLSCDNAQSVHPNHPEYQDKNHATYMNGGIVIKYNARQHYTSDAVSAAIFGLICEEAGVPFQRYANRADMSGGYTLGNIANTHVSVNTVDIGLAQLAMHSSYETAGAKDTEYMVKALKTFFKKSLLMESDGEYSLV